mmetsp:Transcript_26018/g.74982  ORF Transcript_26018/g.74982 Transcript_26018/m.74982 type:complete len:212 (-) Transcript_26018:805-1440(-)
MAGRRLQRLPEAPRRGRRGVPCLVCPPGALQQADARHLQVNGPQRRWLDLVPGVRSRSSRRGGEAARLHYAAGQGAVPGVDRLREPGRLARGQANIDGRHVQFTGPPQVHHRLWPRRPGPGRAGRRRWAGPPRRRLVSSAEPRPGRWSAAGGLRRHPCVLHAAAGQVPGCKDGVQGDRRQWQREVEHGRVQRRLQGARALQRRCEGGLQGA